MRVWFKLVGLIVLFMAPQFFFSLASIPVVKWLHLSPTSIELMSWVLFLSNLLAATLLFSTRILSWRATFRKYPFRASDFCPLLLLLLLSIIPVNGLTELLQLEDTMKTSFAGIMTLPLGVLSIVVVGPLVEELIFRKAFIDTLLQANYKPVWAMLISSLAFGIIHANPAQIPGACLLGLLFGWIYWHTKSIWIVWALHAVNNLIGVIGFYIWDEDIQLQDLLGQTGMPVAMLLSAAAFAVLFGWFRKRWA